MATAAELKADVTEHLTRVLATVNGRRRERTLGLADCLRQLRKVVEGKAWAFAHGGSVANAYNYPAHTTVCLAARVGGQVFLGVGIAAATSASPGRAWRCLQQWGDEGPRGGAEKAAAKWAAWTKEPGVVELTDPEIDLLLGATTD